MDLKALFHNPHAYSDADLALVKGRLRAQSYTPWMTAFFAGSSMYVFDMAVLKRRVHNPYAIAAATVIGFGLGNVAASRMNDVNLGKYSADV